MLSSNPKCQELSYQVLAVCSSADEDEETTARYSAQLVELSPSSYAAWFNLGVACQRTGRLEMAVDAYKQALSIDAERQEAQANLGATLHESENLEEAGQFYSAALRFSPDQPGIHWNLGIVAESQGRFTDAQGHYEKVVALQPGWKEAAARLSRLS